MLYVRFWGYSKKLFLAYNFIGRLVGGGLVSCVRNFDGGRLGFWVRVIIEGGVRVGYFLGGSCC